MNKLFNGCYYKHQKDNNVLCIIVGNAGTDKFIQIITNENSYNLPFFDGNEFSENGIRVDINTKHITLSGEIKYENLSPIKYDIMGPFKYFPMECKHGIISMYHNLKGKLFLNGKELDFSGGTGYTEKDSGKSFPSSYCWIQANDFIQNCSIMASIATIPFLGFHFKGCICIVYYKGKEYRLATYLGVKILLCTKDTIILQQGKYRLEIKIFSNNGCKLNAPQNGKMSRKIIEAASCCANFKFFIKENKIFDSTSYHTSFEYENL